MGKKLKKQTKAHGDAFLEEPVGSAELINLDGQWEHDFTNDKETGK